MADRNITNHASLSQRGHPLVSARIQAAGPAQLAISVITVEEQLRGWLAAIRNATPAQARATTCQWPGCVEVATG